MAPSDSDQNSIDGWYGDDNRWTGIYETSVHWGSSSTWYRTDILRVFRNGMVLLGDTYLKNVVISEDGNTFSWTREMNSSAGTITFQDNSNSQYFWGSSGKNGYLFQGSLQSGNAGPVDFRGAQSISSWAGTYQLATKFGGVNGTWNEGGTLSINQVGQIKYNDVQITNYSFSGGQLAFMAGASGGKVNFACGLDNPYYYNGNFDNLCFTGALESPGSGPVDFRGLDTDEFNLINCHPSSEVDRSRAATTTTKSNWKLKVKTSTTWGAGFDGDVEITLFLSGKVDARASLPQTSFVAGHTDTFDMDFPGGAVQGDLESILIQCSRNFWDDQWGVEYVEAYNLTNSMIYKIEVNEKVPVSGGSYQVTSKQTFANPGVTAYIWSMRLWDKAVGHSSLGLTDGTHISWWPSGEGVSLFDPGPLPGAPLTYAADVSSERVDPDFVLYLPQLDEAAIVDWWSEFNVPGQEYYLYGQNCSRTVKDALYAGGAEQFLTTREKDIFDMIIVWTPSDINSLVEAIIS